MASYKKTCIVSHMLLGAWITTTPLHHGFLYTNPFQIGFTLLANTAEVAFRPTSLVGFVMARPLTEPHTRLIWLAPACVHGRMCA
jgi:hypothetical protein